MPRTVRIIRRILLDPNVDMIDKANALKEIENNHEAQEILFKHTNPSAKGSQNKLRDIALAVLKKEKSWFKRVQFLKNCSFIFKNESGKKIPPPIIGEIAEHFAEAINAGEVSIEQVKYIFHQGPLSHLEYSMADEALFILENKLPSQENYIEIFEAIFSGIFSKLSTQANWPLGYTPNTFDAIDFDMVHKGYIQYLLKNLKIHEKFINNLGRKHPLLFKGLSKIETSGMDFTNFFTEGSQNILGDSVFGNLRDIILESIHSSLARGQIVSSLLPNALPYLYEDSIRHLAVMIFIKHSQNLVTQAEVNQKGDNTHAPTYTNNEGYPYGSGHNANRLFLEESLSTPIGYSITLPPNGIKCNNVLVDIYGGTQKNGMRSSLDNNVKEALLKNGTAVVQLNLPDLLELDVFQGKMPKDLFEKIQACIDKFYQTLKHHPETLHEDLRNIGFNEMDIFLFGESFGGTMSMRHSQMYPGTYSGYISASGGLSMETMKAADLDVDVIRDRVQFKPWLDPALTKNIVTMEDPVLLIHTPSDNNVNIKVTTDFYNQIANNEELQKKGKNNLAKIYIYNPGNPIPIKKEMYNKGHYIPTKGSELTSLINIITGFMHNKSSILPTMSAWQAYKYDTLANKFFRAGTLQQKFIAEMLDKDRIDPEENKFVQKMLSATEREETWKEHYQPLYFAMYYVDTLSKDNAALSNVVQKLEDENWLTDEMIGNALSYQQNVFSQYIQEMYDVQITKDMLNTPEMINQFRQSLRSLPTKNSAEVKYMLFALYLSNPDLLLPEYNALENSQELITKSQEAKRELIATFTTNRRMISNVWKQAAKKIVSQPQDENVNVTSMFSSPKKSK